LLLFLEKFPYRVKFYTKGRFGAGRKVLKMDRPLAGGFLSLTALQAEGCGLPLRGNAYKVSVTRFAFLCHRA
ncbi:hypothetical protein, partial [uncultured Dialister sp.]|uniref:hypothetical protein n=1 Tax=uncultured Dialister sp. TaxID=278064 RepID=UPI0026593523